MAKILKYQITFQHEENTAEEGLAENKEWCFFKNTFADVWVQAGGTSYQEEGAEAFTRVTFTIRYDKDINYSKRIKYNGQIYTINHIENVDRNHWMKIISVNWQDD